MTKPKLTTKKINGDDNNSWAVLINNRICFSGLNKRSLNYYKSLALETFYEKEIAKKNHEEIVLC